MNWKFINVNLNPCGDLWNGHDLVLVSVIQRKQVTREKRRPPTNPKDSNCLVLSSERPKGAMLGCSLVLSEVGNVIMCQNSSYIFHSGVP